MAVNINPIKLSGNWAEGYALDVHVISSSFVDYDEYGNPIFDTTYSEIGKLLHDFKYRNSHENLEEIVLTIIEFLKNHSGMTDFDTIIPVPPTKYRDYQPTIEIGRKLAQKLDKSFFTDVLEKTSQIESKTLSMEEKESLKGTIEKEKVATRQRKILLIDDLYKTGSTMKECVEQLRADPMIKKILVLAITKTKNP